MVVLKVALRNIWRNGRRSLMTTAVLAIGAVALILLGEYRGMAVIGIETGAGLGPFSRVPARGLRLRQRSADRLFTPRRASVDARRHV